MITRRNIIALAIVTAVGFVIAAIIGNDNDGVAQVIGDIAWYSFLLGALLLIAVGVAQLAGRIGARGRSAD